MRRRTLLQTGLAVTAAPAVAQAAGHRSNWSAYRNDQVEELLSTALRTFEPEVRDPVITKAHADAPWVFIGHDLNPCALSPLARGYRQTQSRYQDFTQVTGSGMT